MFIVYYPRVDVSVWKLVPEGTASPVHHDDMTDNNNGNKKEPDTSRSIKWCHTDCSLDTGLPVSAGVPRPILRDVMSQYDVQLSNYALFYKDNDNTFRQLKYILFFISILNVRVIRPMMF